MLNEFCLSNQKIFGENVVKELGDVFKEVKTGKNKKFYVKSVKKGIKK